MIHPRAGVLRPRDSEALFVPAELLDARPCDLRRVCATIYARPEGSFFSSQRIALPSVPNAGTGVLYQTARTSCRASLLEMCWSSTVATAGTGISPARTPCIGMDGQGSANVVRKPVVAALGGARVV